MATISFSPLSGFLSLTNCQTDASCIINMKHCRNLSLVSCNISGCRDYGFAIGDTVSFRNNEGRITGQVVDFDSDSDSDSITIMKSGKTYVVSTSIVNPVERQVWALEVEYDSTGDVVQHFLADQKSAAREIWNAIQTQMMEGSPGFVTAGEVHSAPTKT